MNGDVLSEVNFANLIEYHDAHNFDALICARIHSEQIPYGVIDCEEGLVTHLTEKPTYTYLINAGIYTINPCHLQQIPDNTFIDMPTIMSKLIHDSCRISSYPLHEYWIDIGRADVLKQAESYYESIDTSIP